MPYKAAKAVAATFCYNIRHALTPLFGKDFLSKCVRPNDPNYAKFLIDPKIVRECTEETNRWREEGVTYKCSPVEQHSPVTMPALPNTPTTPTTPTTPQMKFTCPPWGVKSSKSQCMKATDQESGYGTDEDPSEKYLFSPEVSPRSQTWASVNRSQSPVSLPAYSPPQRWLTSVPGGFNDEQLRAKRTLSKVACGDEGADRPLTAAPVVEDGNDLEAEYVDGYHTRKELGAAEILLNLSAADSALHRTKRTRRGSKY